MKVQDNTQVYFKDSNKNQVIAKGFTTDQDAASAVDKFLEKEGNEYGREEPYAEEGVYYFRVVTD